MEKDCSCSVNIALCGMINLEVRDNKTKERLQKKMKLYDKSITIDKLMKTEQFNQFNEKQKEQIRLGLDNNLDISTYINPEFNWKQMKEIRLGILDNVKVSVYAKPELDWEQMKEIRLVLKNTNYGSHHFSSKFLENITFKTTVDIKGYYPDFEKITSKGK